MAVLYSLLVSVFVRVGRDYDLGLVNLVNLFDYRTKSNGSITDHVTFLRFYSIDDINRIQRNDYVRLISI